MRGTVVIAVLALGTAAAGSAPVAPEETRVEVFLPAVPAGKSRSGHCWTDSIAIGRPGVWRCMTDNEIYDPCFAVPKLDHAVVCDARPTGDPGFVLELTQPLPKPSLPPAKDALPWLLKLADGSTCEVLTGTVARVKGRDLPFSCSDSRDCDDDTCSFMTGLTQDLKRGKTWTAEKITFSAVRGKTRLLKRERIRVEAVWR